MRPSKIQMPNLKTNESEVWDLKSFFWTSNLIPRILNPIFLIIQYLLGPLKPDEIQKFKMRRYSRKSMTKRAGIFKWGYYYDVIGKNDALSSQKRGKTLGVTFSGIVNIILWKGCWSFKV